MSTLRVELLDDRVRFHVHESKPYGIPDEERVDEVCFDSPGMLGEPPRRGLGYSCTALFWIPQRAQWIGYEVSSYQERSMGPNEEDCDGPFVVENEPPPTPEELAGITEGRPLVERVRRP